MTGDEPPCFNKKKQSRRNESHRVIHEKFRNLVSNFFIDMPLHVAIIFAKAIADNLSTIELLNNWLFYKFPSTEFLKLWDQIGRKHIFVEFFF